MNKEYKVGELTSKLIYEESQKLYDENTNLKQVLNEIREYINTAKITKDGVFLVKESTWGQEVLQIIDKAIGDDKN